MIVYNDNLQVPENNEKEQLNFEEALLKVGATHYYQKRAFLIFGMQWFLVNWILFCPVFLFRDPFVNCENDPTCLLNCNNQNPDKLDQKCKDFICGNPELNRHFVSSPYLTSAFDTLLTCQQSLQSTISSSVYIGSLIGFFVFSFVGDNYGRKLSLSISWLLTSVGGLLVGLSFNLPMVAVGLFLAGFGGNPSITIHYAFINEHTLGHFRDFQNVGVQIFFAVGEFAIIGIAYVFDNWRILTLGWIAGPLLLMNLGQLFIFESPLFIYSKSKRKCVKTLNKIAVLNGKPEILMSDLQDNPQMRENNKRVYSIIDLLKYASLRYTFIAGVLLFFGIQVVYYGISFACDQMGLGFYQNMLIVAFAELVAYILTDFFVVRLERKKWILIGFLIIGVMSILFIFKSESQLFKILQGSFAGVMKFIICVIWALGYVYVSELFPSVVRSLALGLISAGGSIGSILQAFLITWSDQLNIHPMVSFGFIGLIAGMFVFPLRETLNQPLLDKIKEDDVRIRKSMIADRQYDNNPRENDSADLAINESDWKSTD